MVHVFKVSINPFHATGLFPYSLKTENQRWGVHMNLVSFLLLKKSKYLHTGLYSKEYEIVKFSSDLLSNVLFSLYWGQNIFKLKSVQEYSKFFVCICSKKGIFWREILYSRKTIVLWISKKIFPDANNFL